MNNTQRQQILQKAREYQRTRRQDPEYRERQRLYQAALREHEAHNAKVRQSQAIRRKLQGRPTKPELLLQHSIHFLKQAKSIHSNKYVYDNVKYVASNKKVTITCLTHGNFNQTPIAHIGGKQGCPKCANIARQQFTQTIRRTTQQFVEEATIIHNNKYDYRETQYVNLNTKVYISCPKHGKFKQEAKAHLRGQGCPACANERRGKFLQSAGELKIIQRLEQLNIKYEQQKTFTDCVYKMQLRYDFFIPTNNLLIEFDGEQHFRFVKKFHKTVETFEIFKHRDYLKTVYAEANKIKLLRISYDQSHVIDELITNAVTL